MVNVHSNCGGAPATPLYSPFCVSLPFHTVSTKTGSPSLAGAAAWLEKPVAVIPSAATSGRNFVMLFIT